MPRLSAALCALGLLTAGGTALAAEPLTLSDHQLDLVTAAAAAGAYLTAFAYTGEGGSSLATGGVRRTDSGPLGMSAFAESDGAGGKAGSLDFFAGNTVFDLVTGFSDSDVGSGNAEIGGQVIVIDGGSVKTAIGFFRGQTSTTGDGVAGIDASGYTEGGTELINRTSKIPLGNQTYFITVAAVRS